MRHHNPFGPFEAFANVMDQVLKNEPLFANFIPGNPSVNIADTAEKYTIELAAPGLEKEDFTITLDKDQLIIKVDKPLAEGEKVKRGFSFNKFERSFHLSKDIDREHIEATYDKGILFVHLAKQVEEERKPTSITIK